MSEEIPFSQSWGGSQRAGRRLLKGVSIGLLALVGISLAWVCMSVTRWGPYTLVGPGYGGPVRTRDGRLRVGPGWKRKVDADFTSSTMSFQFSNEDHRCMVLTPELDAAGVGSSSRSIELRYFAGWLVVSSRPPVHFSVPRSPVQGVARLP